MTTTLAERYAANMLGVLSCFDRMLITGTLPGACYAQGMTNFLSAAGIRIFDYARFADQLRERTRERALEVDADNQSSALSSCLSGQVLSRA